MMTVLCFSVYTYKFLSLVDADTDIVTNSQLKSQKRTESD